MQLLKPLKNSFFNKKPPKQTLDILKFISGLFWTITYILIILKGFEDKTFGMPLIALCANISWEFIFGFIYPHGKTQRIINIIWFLFDVIIVGQFLMFGQAHLNLPSLLFYLYFLIVLGISFWIIKFITHKLNDFKGIYSSLGQNLLMSILFVMMLINRDSIVGQSIYIALFKMLGTLIPSIAIALWIKPTRTIKLLGISIFIFDLIYFFMLLNYTL